MVEGEASRPGDDLRQLADEVDDPTSIYRKLPAWRQRSLVALSHASPPLSRWAIEFEAATGDLRLPDPSLAESWDVWDFEEAVRKAAAILVGAAAELDQRSICDAGPLTPDSVRDAIANALAQHVKSYDLPQVCVGLGLADGDQGEAFSSKRAYVKSRLLQKRGDELVTIGESVVDEFGSQDLMAIVDLFRQQRLRHASPGAGVLEDRLIDLTDWDGVQRVWKSALEKVGSEPDGAITAARTVLESVCKHICDERNVRYENSWDLSRLYKTASAAMNIAPDQHVEQVIKQILSGVATVVTGLAALRNIMSDSHGQGKRAVRPSPRHAKLAVNTACAVAGFLIDTHIEKPALPAG